MVVLQAILIIFVCVMVGEVIRVWKTRRVVPQPKAKQSSQGRTCRPAWLKGTNWSLLLVPPRV